MIHEATPCLCRLLFLDSSVQSFATRQLTSTFRFHAAPPTTAVQHATQEALRQDPRSPTLVRRARQRRACRVAPQPPTSAESDSEQNFSVENLPVLPSTPAARQLSIQQGTILKLRAENERLSMVEDRLQALEDAAAWAHVATPALPSTPPAPFTPHTTAADDGCKPINMGEVTWAEYYAALRQLAADPNCPPAWWPHLHTHEEELAIMVISWDWPTCRRWSEKVFQMVAEGRLKEGWEGWAAIKDLQRDICRDAPWPQTARTYYHSYDQYRLSHTPSVATAPAPQTHTAPNPHEDYNKETDGRACSPWNWGKRLQVC